MAEARPESPAGALPAGAAKFAEPIAEALACAPEPGRAWSLAAGVLAAAGERLDAVAVDRGPALARLLRVTCGVAPFFAPFLMRNPQWLLDLLDEELSIPRDHDALRARLELAFGEHGDADADAGEVLRRFKYYELARLSVRDASDELVPLEHTSETLAEISALADVLLSRALEATAVALAAEVGPPHWTDENGGEVRLSFCTLGLGKLGSEELNYSSDVDLVYVYGGAPLGPLRDGPSGLSPVEYFTRLAQRFGKLVAANNEHGFLYRIDTDLRPEGSRGALVVSDDALADYYENWAHAWEKAAFMKARPVAGDEGLGWRTIRAVAPMIYRSHMDYAGVESIRTLRQKVEEARGSDESRGFDVKVGAGGIRDVEFVAQALQLMHGGRIHDVRERSTQRALATLCAVGVLGEDEYQRLIGAYRFLRRVENRLQMEAERQTHKMPTEPAALERLVRAVGYLEPDAVAAFDADLDAHRSNNREIFDAFFPHEGADRILDLFATNVPRLMAFPASRQMIEQLAGQFGTEIDAAASPERALNNLDRLLSGVGERRFYYELLMDRPELIPRLVAMFSDSEYLSSYLARDPRLIEPVFEDPDVRLLSGDQLRADLAALRASLEGLGEGGALGADEVFLASLRRFQQRQVLNIGLLDLAAEEPAEAVEGALTELAEVCVQNALDELRGRGMGGGARFLVTGMGKLASRELGYGSDLDVVFLYDPDEESDAARLEAQQQCVRLAQKLIASLHTRTAEGACYEIDARLRPSGNQGLLVTSRAAFVRYHASGSEVWERQALLRARPVAGDESLAREFEAIRLEVLSQPMPDDLADQIHHIRRRMEAELARETRVRRDFKTGRGGVLDVESVAQFLQLRHGREDAELLEVARTEHILARLRDDGFLSEDHADTLIAGWDFLKRLGSRLRIVENRSLSDVDEERGDLDGLALRLGYPGGEREGGARRALLRDYTQHTEAIRAAYLAVLGVAED